MRNLHRRIRTRGRIGLLVYGLILGCVGLADVYRGLDFSARTVGAFLVTAAIVIVGSCSAALASGTPASWRRWAPLTADLVVGVVSGWIIYRVQSNFVFQPVLVVTATAVISAALLAACLIWGDAREIPELPPPNQPPPSVTPSVTDRQARSTVVAAVIASVGALLAASLTIPQFWYSARYEPSSNPPVVQTEASIENVEMRADHVELTVEIKVENKGKTPVRMLTSMYEITGTSWIVLPKEDHDRELPYENIVGGNYGSAARVSPSTLYSPPEHIQVGPVGEDYAWIGPDEAVQTTLLARAPRDPAISLYRISVDVAVARADRVEVEDRPEQPRQIMTCDGARIAQDRRPLAHRGVFDWLTESDRELVTFWVLDGGSGWESPWWPPFPWNGASIQHADHDCGHVLKMDHDGLEDDAMVGWASTVAEAGRPQEAGGKP
ncbi:MULTISPECIES: hypothetical protein [Streptomyces]|uniref:hypothetical protein n=1 Tax=Streptomyces sp. PAN_FS17 TaxID=1855351 RepID=UPI0008998A8B|nr:hypothetical protein [Streptomyces sp. PAN_FS17]SEB60579.1 hypothetical protein SAMN05216482_0166 [Streptomyces sp. PAN_FS17]